MNRILRFFLVLSIASVLFGCQKEVPKEPASADGETISFVIANDNLTTKAGYSSNSEGIQLASYDMDMGDDIVLVETVSDMMDYPIDPSLTKGTPIYTENFDDKYGEDFYATAFEPQEEGILEKPWASEMGEGTGAVKLEKTDDKTYSVNYSDNSQTGLDWNVHWPDGGKLLYFLQAPYTTTSDLSPKFYADGSIQFDYADPNTPSTVGGRSTIVDGAASQKDILFTSKEVSKPADGSPSQNNILMYHALTGVKFKFGNVDKDVETKITNVTFKGILANGHCTITPDYTAATKSATCTVWGDHSSGNDLIVDYSQAFSDTISYDKSNSSFAEAFYDGKTNIKNLGSTTDGSEILLMVPQELKDVEVMVDFTVNGTPYQRSVKLTSTWKAGEIHTYTLTVHKVNVHITDKMSEDKTEKSEVVTSNNGNFTAYIRATYALAWYYGDGDDAICVAAYQEDGTFTDLGGANKDDSGNLTWIKGSDGYYYYTWPVLPGKDTKFHFFDTFTAPVLEGKTGPFPEAHLEMNILLQGVMYDKEKKNVEEAWGDVFTVGEDGKPTTTKIVDVLSTEIESSEE